MRNFRIYGLCAVAATALLMAGCGGGGSTRAEAPAQTDSRTPAATVTPANAVTLPAGHGITETMEYTIAAGMTRKVAGVRFSCAAGDAACTVSVMVDEDVASATSDGGTVTAEALDATGYQAFENLAIALLDTTTDMVPDVTGEAATIGVQRVVAILRSGLYHGVTDDPGTNDVTEPNLAGVTTSLTTHDRPTGNSIDDAVRGVSDIAVTVEPSTKLENEEEHASKSIKDVAVEDGDQTPDVDESLVVLADPVIVDAEGIILNPRTADFDAQATWSGNPADEWMAELVGKDDNTAGDDDPLWTHVFEKVKAVEGGRTLRLDLRSDYQPNLMGARDTVPDMENEPATQGIQGGITIAIGPDGGENGGETGQEIRADWSMIVLDDVEGGMLGLGQKLDLMGDDPATTMAVEGLAGSFMGVKGVFTCAPEVDQQSTSANECEIEHYTSGKMGVSSEDSVLFIPYVYMPDTDWLTAGVWLTIPDDEDDGDYAIGAFVYGNDPFVTENLDQLTGTAKYVGEAFGRYAERDGDHKETGSFTADATLTATFGAAGVIEGELENFMANGQLETWDVHFQEAMLAGGGATSIPANIVMFNSGATGHARGHALDGYWNGQFYGNSSRPEIMAALEAALLAQTADNELTESDETMATRAANDARVLQLQAAMVQPGSAAGTFGLTARDREDDYSLTVGGAYAAHNTVPAAPAP